MLSQNTALKSVYLRQSESELRMTKQFIQTHRDLAHALLDKIGTPHRISLDKPGLHVGEEEITTMLNSISTWMENSPGLRDDVRVALAGIAEKVKLEPDGDALLGRIKDIIDTHKPENFSKVQSFAVENIASFLKPRERPVLYSLNRTTGNKLKHARAEDLARTAMDAVRSTDKLAKWLHSVEHLDDKRYHSQLLGVAAIASNSARDRIGVGRLLTSALGKLEPDQESGAEYMESVGKAIVNEFRVADWSDQLDLFLRLDADFQSPALAGLTEKIVGSYFHKNSYDNFDAAVLCLDRLPFKQRADVINRIYYAVDYGQFDPALPSHISLLDKAYFDLPNLHRSTALPGYAFARVGIYPSPAKENKPWIISTCHRIFDEAVDLGMEVKDEKSLYHIVSALTVCIKFLLKEREHKLKYMKCILALSARLSSVSRGKLLLRLSESLKERPGTLATCLEAFTDEIPRAPTEFAEQLALVIADSKVFLDKLGDKRPNNLYLPTSLPLFGRMQLLEP